MSPHVSVGNESVPEAEASASHSDVDLTTSGSVLGTNTTDVTNPSCHSSFVNGTCDVKTLLSVIADTLDFYFPPILFVAGIICNALVVMVMQSRHFRHISTSFYMSITAGVDFASLLVSLPAHYLYVNFPEVFDNVRQAHIMCSFFNLFGWGSSDMGLLLTVAMTTERSLAIKFPLKATVLCSVRRAKIVSGGLFALEFVKVGHLLFTSRVATKGGHGLFV
ncbi:uncharacterized protein LOC112557497 [Pomacea canaliculata]|uniref:uncharacterized protein LOC112557497 n=1 Tax=Pomacea canaliculata TaxID=400727 RepID=UPI000D737A45|nr:uncharacterized protein LOC112557497 [Pomacea canaliculata]